MLDSQPDEPLPGLIVCLHILHRHEVVVEVGETLPGGTNSHQREGGVSDGQSLYGGGDGTAGPARERLVDQDPSSSEASDDDKEPEKSGKPSFISDMGKTMYGGGTQELLHTLDTNHPSFLVDCWSLKYGGTPTFTIGLFG